MIALAVRARVLSRLLAVAAALALQVLPAARAATPAYDIVPETGRRRSRL
jgi:hypothetical protein